MLYIVLLCGRGVVVGTNVVHCVVECQLLHIVLLGSCCTLCCCIAVVVHCVVEWQLLHIVLLYGSCVVLMLYIVLLLYASCCVGGCELFPPFLSPIIHSFLPALIGEISFILWLNGTKETETVIEHRDSNTSFS